MVNNNSKKREKNTDPKPVKPSSMMDRDIFHIQQNTNQFNRTKISTYLCALCSCGAVKTGSSHPQTVSPVATAVAQKQQKKKQQERKNNQTVALQLIMSRVRMVMSYNTQYTVAIKREN